MTCNNNVNNFIVNSYVLNIANIAQLPDDIFDHNQKHFSIHLSRDRDSARELSTNLQFVVGVTLPGYKFSADARIIAIKPAIDSPIDSSVYASVIEAKVVSVQVIDKRSKMAVLSWSLKSPTKENTAP